MIARIWHGRTKAEDAEEYLAYMRKTGFDAYASVPGHRGLYVLRQVKEGVADFHVLSLWDSTDAIRAFAGSTPEVPVYYPEDERYLLEFEDEVRHYEVVHRSESA